MGTTWNKLSVSKPADQAEVWVRILYWYGEPVKAIWDGANNWFVTTVTGLIIPAWAVSRWKNQ
jgi:hypothetical protein